MFLRTPSVPLVLTLASGVFATSPAAAAQQPRSDGNLYQVQRGERFDDWTLQGFRDLDADGNGRITAAEWSYDREDFRRADHNGDGILTQREFLGEAANDRDRGPTDGGDASATDDARFVDLDANRDDKVSRSEWRSDRITFDRLDENRDGYLTRAEMAVPAAAAVDFSSLDTDRNGVISRGEWLQSAASFERLDTNRDGRLTSLEYAGGRAGATTGAGATRSAAYRAGYERGMADGRTAGRQDRDRNQGWDLDGQRELEQADSGYYEGLGSRADYQAGYRAAFRIGYREGFGPR
jgi:EF hand